MMRTGKTERKIDAMTTAATGDIEALYDEALTKGFKMYRDTFAQMRDIMGGTQKPPRWCVTQFQKDRWKQKKLMKLLDQTSIADGLGALLATAGDYSVSRIKRFGLDVYKTAYKGTMDKLRG